MTIRPTFASLAAVATLLAGCSAGQAEEPTAGRSSTSESPAPTEPAPAPPPDPCTLLEPHHVAALFPSRTSFREASWTHELRGKDGNFHGCVVTRNDINYARFGYALTPNAYVREWKEGKLFGEDLSPTESPGLGDRGYIRHALPDGFESMAKSGPYTVYVTGLGTKRPMDVVGALQYLLAQTSEAMTSTPIHVEEPCPAADSPEVSRILGDEIDVAVGREIDGNVFCAYHDPSTRTQLSFQAYTMDPVAAALTADGMRRLLPGETFLDRPPGAVRTRRFMPRDGEVDLTTFLPAARRYLGASLAWDAAGYVAEKPLGGDPRALFRIGADVLADYERP